MLSPTKRNEEGTIEVRPLASLPTVPVHKQEASFSLYTLNSHCCVKQDFRCFFAVLNKEISFCDHNMTIEIAVTSCCGCLPCGIPCCCCPAFPELPCCCCPAIPWLPVISCTWIGYHYTQTRPGSGETRTSTCSGDKQQNHIAVALNDKYVPLDVALALESNDKKE